MWALVISLCAPSGGSYFLTWINWFVPNGKLEGIFWSFLSEVLSTQGLCLQPLGALPPQMTSSIFFNSEKWPELAWVPSLCIITWNRSSDTELREFSASLICFLFLRDYYPVLPNIQYLKNIVACILSALIDVSGRRVNLVPIFPSWLEVEFIYFVICFCFLVFGLFFIEIFSHKMLSNSSLHTMDFCFELNGMNHKEKKGNSVHLHFAQRKTYLENLVENTIPR